MTWDAMPIFMWSDRKIDWQIRDAWPKAGMGAVAILVRDPIRCESMEAESLDDVDFYFCG
jgi:hypothetical protein